MVTITIPANSTLRMRIPAKNDHLKSKNRATDDVERIGVSVNDAATMISLSVRSVWTLIKEGKIRHTKYGKRCIVSVQSLREFIDGNASSLIEKQ